MIGQRADTEFVRIAEDGLHGSGGRGISLLRLLAAFLKIGCIGFGGGMAVIALMGREFVQKRKLLTAEEFLHGVGLGQLLGSFAVNAAFFVGYRLAGPVGGILSASVFLMPSLALVTALSHLYFRYHSIPALQSAVVGMGPVVIALILNAAWSLGRNLVRSPVAIGIAGVAMAAGALKINAVWIMAAAGITGLLLMKGRSDRTLFGAVLAPMPLASGSLLGLTALTFFKIGFLFFGGGFALIPLLHHKLVVELGWLSSIEFVDGVAISNLTPGPIAVLATFAGYRVAGVAGALVATIALLAPAIGLTWFMSRQYARYHGDQRVKSFLAGVNPAVTGLILSAALLLGSSAIRSWRGGVLCAFSLLVLQRFRAHPAFVLAIGSAAGYAALLP